MKMRDQSSDSVIFIAGPTASGKSAAALGVAEKLDGEIVNADAMQVYRDLHVVTARPSTDDERCVRHHLYGMLDGAEHFSAGRWAAQAAATINDIIDRNKSAIIVGGTGLYFRALEQGMSPIPETPLEIREKARARRDEIGAAAFHAEVIASDPAVAHLPEGDSQRLMRAWEVFAAKGKPLSYFQNLPRTPMIAPPRHRVVIEPDRAVLYARCDARASQMLSTGAIEEVKRLLARGLDSELPVMKALGVRELAQLINGEISEEEALAQLQQNTRRFAKRQLTWFRGQASNWPRVQNTEEAIGALT